MSSSTSSKTRGPLTVADGSTTVATLIRYGAGPFVVGRLVLADGAASEADTTQLLRQAVAAIRHARAEVSYFTTPAGFHKAELPSSWSGTTGWKTGEDDFSSLLPVVTDIARTLAHQSGSLGGPVHYLSLGIDLKAAKGKAHIETSVLYDTKADTVVGVTGKSYPTTGQAENLIRNAMPKNHIVDLDGDRTLTLVCHDLSTFHPRGRAVRKGRRDGSGNELELEISQRKPTVALHQAHTVESPATWTLAWNAFRQENADSLRGWTTAFRYLGFNSVPPKNQLSRDVLDRTRGGDLPAIDVVLSSPATARQLA